MTNVVKLVVANKHTSGRACKTCKYREGDFCGFHGGWSTFTARRIEKFCGPDGRNWSPSPPLGGFFGWIRKLLIGEQND
jgi:hypothetical protein